MAASGEPGNHAKAMDGAGRGVGVATHWAPPLWILA